jgi:thiamine pyrophosphate-dependent acetolactate synthase large subunit-like protein
MEELGRYLTPSDVVVSDTGCPLAWAMQTIPFKGRFIHAFNQTPMGYGLGAAIGAAGEHPGRVVLLTGDGGLSECINEFATVSKHNLNIKTILFNNRGHAMCRQTQKQWLGGIYHGTSDKDLATPNFSSIANAYCIPAYGIKWLEEFFTRDGPGFLEIDIDPEQGVVPQVRFGKSIEDADPALPEEELARIMA